MHRLGTKACIAVASVALLGSITIPVHAASASADEAAIRAQTVSWGKAYNGGDAKGWPHNMRKTHNYFRRV